MYTPKDLANVFKKWEHLCPFGIEIGAATVERSTELPQKIKNGTAL